MNLANHPEPITERRLVCGPIVYGYLRLAGHNPARRAALTVALSGYCDRHELVLAGVFTDLRDQADGRVRSTAFVGLLDALTADGSYGVVTPSAAHLGGRDIGGRRAALIARTGRRLMLIRGAAPAAPTGRGAFPAPDPNRLGAPA